MAAPRLFLDACVLYPVAVREILLGYARAGGFAPLYSARALEEWARAAAAKQGVEAALRAQGDAALLRATFPEGEATGWEMLEIDHDLPDAADNHVPAAARAGGAEAILTFNLRDFPVAALARFGLTRRHPDEFLRAAWDRDRARLDAALAPIRAAAPDARRFLKRAGLPRLAKALG